MKFLLIIVSAFISSCAISDVSNRNEFWGLYTQGAEYRLSHDVFLVENRPTLISEPELIPPQDYPEGDRAIRWGEVPPSIRAYETYLKTGQSYDLEGDWKKRLDEFGVKILGIVRTGTRIRPNRLKRRRSWEPFLIGYSDSLEIYGEILDGEYAGTTAKMSELSKTYVDNKNKELWLFQPLPRLLVREPYNHTRDSDATK